MSSRSADNATTIATAIGWTGLSAISFLVVWSLPKDLLPWFVKIPGAIIGSLAFLGYAIEAMSQELTLRRWAISQLLFTTAGIVFLIAAILNYEVLGFGRLVLFVAAAIYLFGAAVCAAAGKDLF